jgi:YVTN family beta-propeller protein
VLREIRFAVPGVPAELVQPVGLRVTSDGGTAFVALGPANRVAVIDTTTFAVEKYLLVGRRVWHLDLTADGKLLFTTNGLTNDVSVIDVASLSVVKSIPVGRMPWGVAVRP